MNDAIDNNDEVRVAQLMARHTSRVFETATSERLMYFNNFDVVISAPHSTNGEIVEHCLTSPNSYKSETYIDEGDHDRVHTDGAIITNGLMPIRYRGVALKNVDLKAEPRVHIDKSAFDALAKGVNITVHCEGAGDDVGLFHFKGMRERDRAQYFITFLAFVSRLNRCAEVRATKAASDDDDE